MLATLASTSLAQNAATDSARSSRDGVYTTGQADRGRDVYAMSCVSCHTPDSHSGPAFTATWDGRPLGELFVYISETMPKSEPGSLVPQEYALVLAYLLRMNGMPAGQTELPPDRAALQRIRFDVKPPPPEPRSRD